jgi:hypothetical protein
MAFQLKTMLARLTLRSMTQALDITQHRGALPGERQMLHSIFAQP